MTLAEIDFDDVPGWGGDDHAAALAPFVKSCTVIAKKSADERLNDNDQFGTYGMWQKICAEAKLIRPGNKNEAKYFWESRFQPYLVRSGHDAEGLFTGYYEPELEGRWSADARFRIPIMSRPDDLVAVDLGMHRDEHKGEHIAGRVVDNKLIPYYSRAEIENGGLLGRGIELFWVEDPVAAFFLHIQGSGRIKLQDGSTVRIGYAGRNGRRYTAIGRELIAIGALTQKDVTAPAIMDWLRANPVHGQAIMHKNQSYIFFRVLDGDEPVGAQGVGLTAGRSLAVDRAFMPLGMPLWLVSTDPLDGKTPIRRLMVAQDTGSAIKGPVRGDVFWGHGTDAATRAGLMKASGRYYLLLPKTAATMAPK